MTQRKRIANYVVWNSADRAIDGDLDMVQERFPLDDPRIDQRVKRIAKENGGPLDVSVGLMTVFDDGHVSTAEFSIDDLTSEEDEDEDEDVGDTHDWRVFRSETRETIASGFANEFEANDWITESVASGSITGTVDDYEVDQDE